MYSAKINGEPTTFGTSGLLYRSNKLMYDRATESIWHQFTGEPVIGPLADSGIKLDFFPVEVTDWFEWKRTHPDTTVLSIDTGVFAPDQYRREIDPAAVYYDYFFGSDETMFPVWNKRADLKNKRKVLGLSIGDAHKAYELGALRKARVLNDTVGDSDVVVVASSYSESARVYESGGLDFSLGPEESQLGIIPDALMDSDGVVWQVTEDGLVSSEDPETVLKRVPTHNSFWFGWSSFYPDTELYTLDEN